MVPTCCKPDGAASALAHLGAISLCEQGECEAKTGVLAHAARSASHAPDQVKAGEDVAHLLRPPNLCHSKQLKIWLSGKFFLLHCTIFRGA